MLIAEKAVWYIEWLATMLYDISGVGYIDEIKKMLTDVANYDTLFNSINKFAGTIKTVAIMLVFVHLLCYILEMSTKEQLTMDVFFKGFLKFLIAFFFVQQCIPLFELLMKLGNSMMDLVYNDLSGGENDTWSVEAISIHLNNTMDKVTWERVTNAENLLDALQGIGACIDNFATMVFLQYPTTLLFWAVTWISSLVVLVVAFSRVLELAIRAVFAPIAIVDIFENGTSGAGFRYVKKYMAVTIQGAVIMMILAMVGSLSGYDVTNPNQFYLNTVLLPDASNLGYIFISGLKLIIYRIAAIGLVFKSQPLCNDIMGV